MAFEVTRGDASTLIATFSFQGSPANLAGCSLVLTVSSVQHNIRVQYTSASSAIVINTANGTASCKVDTSTFPNVDGNYMFSWALTDSLGNRTTMKRDALVVFADL